jgi:undecaprenyl-diphosphatase
MGLPAPVRGPSQAASEVFHLDDDIVGYSRSPSDAVRLIVFGLATIALLVLTRWAESTVLAFENDVVALFGRLNSSVEHALNQTLSIAAGLMSVAVFVPPLLLKRYRIIGYIVVANLATVLLVGRDMVVIAASRSRRSSIDSGLRREFAQPLTLGAHVVVRHPRPVRGPAMAAGGHGDP